MPDASARFVAVVAVDAVPVRPPTKPPVAVIIPEVLILAVVDNPRAVVAVDAIPVRPPTKPPVEVIIPEVFILEVVENPRAVVAVVAVPVIVSDTFKLPTTSRVAVGCVVPIPILPLEYTKSVAPAKFPLLAL